MAGKYEDRRLLTAFKSGEDNPNAKLTRAEVEKIRERVENGEKQAIVAAAYGVSRSTVCHIVNDKYWK